MSAPCADLDAAVARRAPRSINVLRQAPRQMPRRARRASACTVSATSCTRRMAAPRPAPARPRRRGSAPAARRLPGCRRCGRGSSCGTAPSSTVAARAPASIGRRPAKAGCAPWSCRSRCRDRRRCRRARDAGRLAAPRRAPPGSRATSSADVGVARLGLHGARARPACASAPRRSRPRRPRAAPRGSWRSAGDVVDDRRRRPPAPRASSRHCGCRSEIGAVRGAARGPPAGRGAISSSGGTGAAPGRVDLAADVEDVGALARQHAGRGRWPRRLGGMRRRRRSCPA